MESVTQSGFHQVLDGFVTTLEMQRKGWAAKPVEPKKEYKPFKKEIETTGSLWKKLVGTLLFILLMLLS